MKKLLITVIVFVAGVCSAYAQGELDQQQKVFFRNERSFAALLNTDGLGISYRAAKRINFLNKRFLEFEAGTLKSPKEYRQRTMFSQGGSFVFGKLNSAFYLRGSYGFQHELYSKEDYGGIAIRYFYSGGPVIALLKPIYYTFYYLIPNTINEYERKDEKFHEGIVVPNEIYGKASFTKGFNEISVVPGLFAKTGFNFEYSKEDKVIHAIEIGGQINAFPKEVQIMFGINNRKVYPSLFVSYRFGIIVDPLHPENNSLSNVFKRKNRE